MSEEASMRLYSWSMQVELQETQHGRPQYGGGLVDGIQFGHGLGDVKIDRALRNVEDFGDFAGRLALAGPAQYLHLSAG